MKIEAKNIEQALYVFMYETEKDSKGSQSHDSQAGVVYYYFGLKSNPFTIKLMCCT
jgi:hypothetical protein